jgi:hypothetical protein
LAKTEPCPKYNPVLSASSSAAEKTFSNGAGVRTWINGVSIIEDSAEMVEFLSRKVVTIWEPRN